MSALDRIFRWTLALVLVAFAILLATLVAEAPALTMTRGNTTYPAKSRMAGASASQLQQDGDGSPPRASQLAWPDPSMSALTVV